jgi:hypothetical protein
MEIIRQVVRQVILQENAQQVQEIMEITLVQLPRTLMGHLVAYSAAHREFHHNPQAVHNK